MLNPKRKSKTKHNFNLSILCRNSSIQPDEEVKQNPVPSYQIQTVEMEDVSKESQRALKENLGDLTKYNYKIILLMNYLKQKKILHFDVNFFFSCLDSVDWIILKYLVHCQFY